MARAFTPKIVTANDLLEGDVVYFTAGETWSRNHADAAVVTSADEADALLASVATQQNRIVGAYLADVELNANGTPRPAHFREAFRTRGPSNYFHGKQASADNARQLQEA